MSKKAVVIGSGIVGMAVARVLSLKGYDVTVIERNDKAVGASIRNFGMIWPIGQPSGTLYNRAIRSKQIWKEIADSTNLWHNESGSLHTAYSDLENNVLEELYEIFSKEGRPVSYLSKDKITGKFAQVNDAGLIGGLFSEDEMIVDPKNALNILANYLEEFLEVQFIWNAMVTSVEKGKVYIGKEILQADIIFLCTGADFELFYPEIFKQLPITKCKLQMMRFNATDPNFDIGTSICGGLSLIHYNSFKAATSHPVLKKHFELSLPEYIKNGIHVMVSQNSLGELTVGDSHEYSLTHDPFDRVFINQLIQDYLSTFINCKDWQLVETWNGIYPKMTDDRTYFFNQPESGIYILNGLGGAGMTLSFGLAEECLSEIE
jgi:FAD dependent oxidoreductase TIGR03364